MPRVYRAATVSSERFALAEGVLFDDRANVTRWVDIDGGDVVYGLGSPTIIHIDTTVGAVALADDGGLLVAGHHGLATISPGGEISLGPALIDRPAARLNDGIVDAAGRFLVGTLALDGPSTREQLLRVSPDGRVEVLRDGLQLSNGLAFSPDGSTLYHVDTFARTVSAHAYDDDFTGEWHVVVDNFTGFPDGMTVDADGNLWVAEYGASLVQCYSPSGERGDRIEIGTPEATCIAFIGDGLAAITSGRETHTDDEAGAVYLCEIDVHGIPENRWAGSTSSPYWK
jgi:sugar lactone lactonase YvrE